MPTGGPKDETPPELLNSIPQQEQLNYTSREIVLTFSEDIRLDKAKQQILITPRIEQEFEIKQRKDRVILEFDSALNDSTTYTINFRQSIVDITEGNPAEQLKLAFSTGDYIDSLSISGNVYHVLSGEKAKKATIALYPSMDTTDLFSGLPTYFTETSDSGTYVIDNIKRGKYRIYAFKDTNNNLKAESQKESYGFLPDTLILEKNMAQINIGLISLDMRELKMLSARQSGTTFDIKTNKFVMDYTLQPLDSTKTIYSNYKDTEHQIISLYNTLPIPDSLGIAFTASDSVNQTISDTVYMKFTSTNRKPGNLTQSYELQTIPVAAPVLNATVLFNKPILSTNLDSLFIRIDSTTQLSLDSAGFTWNKLNTELKLKYKFDPKLFEQPEKTDSTNSIKKSANPPVLYSGRGAFVSVEQDSNKQQSATLQFATAGNLGTIILNIGTEAENSIIQLLQPDGKVVAQKKVNGPKMTFKNLEPNNYMVRAIIDTNNNSSWDPGNLYKKQLPEKIVYLIKRDKSKTLVVKANWEVTENFTY